jgi:hypothetical protein
MPIFPDDDRMDGRVERIGSFSPAGNAGKTLLMMGQSARLALLGTTRVDLTTV